MNKDWFLFDIPTYIDNRGKLSILDKQNLPFNVNRIFFQYEVNKNQIRGNHANKKSSFILIVPAGSVNIKLNNGIDKLEIMLNSPNKALFVNKMIWKVMSDFSPNSFLFVLSDFNYDSNEYIYDYNEFLFLKGIIL